MPKIGMRAPDGSEDAMIGQLMFDAIHRGRSAYTAAQRRAWLAVPNSGAAWTARLAGQEVVVLRQDGRPIGVMTLKGSYIDLAYIAPDMQGHGLFRRLYDEIERRARASGVRRLSTHASLMAQPAFLAVGFRVIRHETVTRDGQDLPRAEMEKALA